MQSSTVSTGSHLLRIHATTSLHQLEKKADFLYSAVGQYIRDAEKDGKPQLADLWKTIREDEQNHIKMLKEELVSQVQHNRFG